MIKWARIINIVALIAAILPIWPYHFYILLRVGTAIVCGILAYTAFKTGKKGWALMLGSTVLIYNPIIPFHLGKELWTIVNILTIGLLGLSFRSITAETIEKMIKKDG